MRGATSLIGHNQPIIRPKVSDKLDYEAELALIIGKPVRHLTKANALGCLAGYACFNDATIRDLLWNVVETLVLITECMTLEPGDVIVTGTPAGVGYARNPPVFMAPGDVCEVEIGGVGILSNPIADEAG